MKTFTTTLHQFSSNNLRDVTNILKHLIESKKFEQNNTVLDIEQKTANNIRKCFTNLTSNGATKKRKYMQDSIGTIAKWYTNNHTSQAKGACDYLSIDARHCEKIIDD